jgi:catechol 2,3-dioxygenase-like lactoylglutathione lyase family enzyme
MSDTPAKSGCGALTRAAVAPRLPAQDLERARAFYAEKLGLRPVEEREGGLRYRCSSTVFSLFATAGDPGRALGSARMSTARTRVSSCRADPRQRRPRRPALLARDLRSRQRRVLPTVRFEVIDPAFPAIPGGPTLTTMRRPPGAHLT